MAYEFEMRRAEEMVDRLKEICPCEEAYRCHIAAAILTIKDLDMQIKETRLALRICQQRADRLSGDRPRT